MSALEARDELARGSISAAEFAAACLERIAEREPQVQAWAYLDPAYVQEQAAQLDRRRARGQPIGPLHGLPVGVKDIIDTRDMPTENGTVLDAGRCPREDAAVAQRLREAGAVILGKTVTTELAVYTPGKTRNPHDARRTPGGSSSGSAAAVAAGMVPLALGSQTNGSVIRPASYCGVVGFKPSRGIVSRRGALTQSPTLDTIGTFSSTIEDAALLADALAFYDAGDPAMRPFARPDLLATALRPPPLRPALALVRSPVWDRAEPDVRDGFAELADALGDAITPVDLPDIFARAHDCHRAIMLADIAASYARYFERDAAALSPRLRGMIEEGLTIRAVDYRRAHEQIAVLNAALEQLFERFDALVTPAATGEAPLGLESTGDPVFCTMWTYLGVPAITLPLLTGSAGLPIGVQIIGGIGNDGRLMRTARWMRDVLAAQGETADPARAGPGKPRGRP